MSHSRPRRRSLARPAGVTVLALLVLAAGRPATADEVPVGTWPLRPQPAVVHRFDPPPTPYAAGHRGVDLAGRPGQPVRTALPGTISFAGTVAGRGVVVVDHGATRTTYEPVDARRRVGEDVAAGDRIGTLQAGGSHCAPTTCLHWGWIADETYLDPLLLVGAGPVRLLPLWSTDGGPGVRPAPPASPPAASVAVGLVLTG